MDLEQLALTGATTLLTYLQYDRLENEVLAATAIAGTLCELLNQLESAYPNVTNDYGWKKVAPADRGIAHANDDARPIDADRYTDFDLTSLS
ncbi:MAG: hypothetical protein WCA35_04355 [Kovacikia sp.]